MRTYENLINDLDNKLKKYFELQKDYICCHSGCSDCCEKGDYPISETELQYIMAGYENLKNDTKVLVQENIKNIKKSGKCPFLIDKKCSVYKYRPIICRVHGLAYFYDNKVKIPFCANTGKNFSKIYDGKYITLDCAIKENLETVELLKEFNCGEIRNLYDWIKN